MVRAFSMGNESGILESERARAGTLLRDLQGKLSPTAKLVGVDIMSQFIPESSQGNISYAVGDVGEPPAPERTGVFDLTHVRYTLAGAAQAGIEKSVQNLAGRHP